MIDFVVPCAIYMESDTEVREHVTACESDILDAAWRGVGEAFSRGDMDAKPGSLRSGQMNVILAPPLMNKSEHVLHIGAGAGQERKVVGKKNGLEGSCRGVKLCVWEGDTYIL